VNLNKPEGVILNCSGGSATCSDSPGPDPGPETGPEPGPDAAKLNPDANPSPDLPYGDEPVVVQRDDGPLANPDGPDSAIVPDVPGADGDAAAVKDGPIDADSRGEPDIGKDTVPPPTEVGPDLPPDRVNGPEPGPEPGPDGGGEIHAEAGPEPPLDGGVGDSRSGTVCSIVSGSTPSAGTAGHPPAANTTSPFCVATCDDIAGWGCSNFDGRQVTVNGVVAACGATLTKVNGYYVFQVSAGTNISAVIYWWGSFNSTCVAPPGGF